MSNAHRATESAASGSNLRDELDVIITLNSVSVIVAEYVPFGANQMVELNHTMGATGRVQVREQHVRCSLRAMETHFTHVFSDRAAL